MTARRIPGPPIARRIERPTTARALRGTYPLFESSPDASAPGPLRSLRRHFSMFSRKACTGGKLAVLVWLRGHGWNERLRRLQQFTNYPYDDGDRNLGLAFARNHNYADGELAKSVNSSAFSMDGFGGPVLSPNGRLLVNELAHKSWRDLRFGSVRSGLYEMMVPGAGCMDSWSRLKKVLQGSKPRYFF